MLLGALLRPVYLAYGWVLEKKVKEGGAMPEHIAIIMDGNRRLAMGSGLLPWDGHRLGAEKLREVLEWCTELGINNITAYAFSAENFSRPRGEVERLYDLFEEYFNTAAEDAKIHTLKVRVRAIGKVELLPERVRAAIERAEERTKDHDAFNLNLAVAYGGRQEVLDAVKSFARAVQEGKLAIEAFDEGTISKNLYTNGLPDPDLIVRTSGEERVSGFLLWQSAYSELYFCETFWPAFRKIDFLRAIRTFQQRKRRFGK